MRNRGAGEGEWGTIGCDKHCDVVSVRAELRAELNTGKSRIEVVLSNGYTPEREFSVHGAGRPDRDK